MRLRVKVTNVLRGLTQRWGPSRIKQELWNKEYAGGRWDHCQDTATDPVYGFIIKHCRRGSILDLGCGAGNTGTELPSEAYRDYTGVDISDLALARASARSASCGRASQNSYQHSDILTYVPARRHDIILFRESIFYIPPRKIRAMLARYERYLEDHGVFMLTVFDLRPYRAIVDDISDVYDIIDRYDTPTGGGGLIFRRRPVRGPSGA